MKKFNTFFFSILCSVRCFADHVKDHAPCSSWLDRLKGSWAGLGSNVQLGIQLVLILCAFYGLMCLFSCGKCGCGSKCSGKSCKK